MLTRYMELRYINLMINKAAERINQLAYVWDEQRNLKLYDAFFEAEDICKEIAEEEHFIYDGNWHDEFDFFCEMEFDNFIFADDCILEGADFKKEANYIGRTSSFYLTALSDYDYPVEAIIEYYIGGYNEIGFEDGKYFLANYDSDYDRWTDWKDIVEQVDEYLHDAKVLADYIDSFKEDQVDIFRDWIYCRIVDGEIYEKSTTHPDCIEEAKEEYHRWRRENIEIARKVARKIKEHENYYFEYSDIYDKYLELIENDFIANFGGNREVVESMFIG